MSKRYDAIIKRLPKDKNIIGAELGVWKGETSYQLLKALPKLNLMMVDRWQVPPDGDSYFQGSRTMSRSTQKQFDDVFNMAYNRVNEFGERCKIYRMTTIEASEYVDNNSLDFVFIDSDHSYIGVTNDLTYWYPKLKIGGLLCGHDWENNNTYNEVKRAVTDFFHRNDIIELDVDHTWFYKK